MCIGDGPSSDNLAGGGRWGSESRPRPAMGASAGSGPPSRGARGAPLPAAVLGSAVWQPSARVQALNAEQIAEIRQRLNVDVEVPEGQPPAAAPIESFKDLVPIGGRLAAAFGGWRGCVKG